MVALALARISPYWIRRDTQTSHTPATAYSLLRSGVHACQRAAGADRRRVQGPLVNNITLPKFIKQHDVDCTSRGPRTPEAALAPLSAGVMSAMDLGPLSETRHRIDFTGFPRSLPRQPKSLSMIQA